jgi:hypothetical protein
MRALWLRRSGPGADMARSIARARALDTELLLARIRAKRANQVRMREARKAFLGVTRLRAVSAPALRRRETLPRDSDSTAPFPA